MATHPKTKVRKKIKYAQGGDVELAGPGVSGRTGKWRDDEDNPASPFFIPLTDRGEGGKARWWAHQAKRSKKPTHGVYDQP